MSKGRVTETFNARPGNRVDKVTSRHNAILFEVRWRGQTEIFYHRMCEVGVSLDGGRLLQCYFVLDATTVNNGQNGNDGIEHPRDCIACISFD